MDTSINLRALIYLVRVGDRWEARSEVCTNLELVEQTREGIDRDPDMLLVASTVVEVLPSGACVTLERVAHRLLKLG